MKRKIILVLVLSLSACYTQPEYAPIIYKHDVLIAGALRYLQDLQEFEYIPTPTKLEDLKKEKKPKI